MRVPTPPLVSRPQSLITPGSYELAHQLQAQEDERAHQIAAERRQRAAARAAATGADVRISNVGTQRPKTFSLDTFKFHSLGDYAATIPEVGTTDSITTRTVCAGAVLQADC